VTVDPRDIARSRSRAAIVCPMMVRNTTA
jgi:hypothetical protein